MGWREKNMCTEIHEIFYITFPLWNWLKAPHHGTTINAIRWKSLVNLYMCKQAIPTETRSGELNKSRHDANLHVVSYAICGIHVICKIKRRKINKTWKYLLAGTTTD